MFTTDGQLAGGRYVLLDDPRGVFGIQNVAPIISRAALRAHGPRVQAVIDAVSRRLTAPVMQRMNAAVQLRGRGSAEVADEFLRSAGPEVRARTRSRADRVPLRASWTSRCASRSATTPAR